MKRVALTSLFLLVIISGCASQKIKNFGVTTCPMLWELMENSGKESIKLRGLEVCEKNLLKSLRLGGIAKPSKGAKNY